MVGSINPVVVVPVHEAKIDELSETSLRHLKRYLGNYRLVLAKPQRLDWSVPGLDDEYFPDESFGTLLRYNQFQLLPEFYERFSQHSHVLIYHLDALVFRDELTQWCETDYDYIGASWYPDLIKQYTGNPWPFAPVGCGNGGLSLRRVSAFLRHLKTRKSTLRHAADRLLEGNFDAATRLWRYRKHLTPSDYEEHGMLNEDVYWGVFAPLIDASFRVATPEIGNRFSFEYDPKFLFETNGGHMPFGCHAWYRFEDARRFWTPHLLAADAPVTTGMTRPARG
jgi:hypothetical protein